MEKEELVDETEPLVVSSVLSLTKAWFWLRAFKITASVASVVIGLSKRASPQAYYWKLTTCPFDQTPDNPAMAAGRMKEPLVILETEKRLGIKIAEAAYIAHLEFRWLAATSDGFVLHDDYRHPNAPDCRSLDCRSNVECKAPFHRPYDYPPLEYVIQTYIQMFNNNTKVTYLTTYWADGQCMRIWLIHWSDAVWLWIMQRLVLFMQFLTLRLCPPPRLLPSVAEPNQELLNGGFKDDLRARLSRRYKVSLHDLIPNIPIERLVYDEDPYYYVEGVAVLKADRL